MLNEKKKEKKSKLSPLIIPNEQTPTQHNGQPILIITNLSHEINFYWSICIYKKSKKINHNNNVYKQVLNILFFSI